MSPDRLDRYVAKRDFAKTPEPKGGRRRPKGGQRFVVQRHRASHLHYDLRLEMDGVLASWAVPKGPTLDPAAKRLAMHVEDHPLEYFDFEGVIPRGGYGAGDVIVWDWGIYEPVHTENPAEAVAEGELHFDVDGEKLKGRFVLIRRGPAGDREQWMLLHKRDDAAVAGWDPEDHPQSVKSGRTNDEVLAKPKAKWSSRIPTMAKWGRSLGPFRAATADELTALNALKKEGEWDLDGTAVRLTNLDKVLFPGKGARGKPVTKRDLVRYNATIAPALLPYLAGRPVNPYRFPDGIEQHGFWHKAVPDYAPESITRWRYDDFGKGETEWYAVVDSLPSLVWMANHAGVELNPWTSRADTPHEPTWALIDIDPGDDTSFAQIRELAQLYRVALDHLHVVGCPKVTGKRGIQIWVPVKSGYTFDDTRDWVEKLSRAVGATLPDLVSWSWRKVERGGKARLDYTQNAINKTLVAPFSTRPAPGAPVSVPIRWEELDDGRLKPDKWTIRTVGARLADAGDPLRDLIGLQQTLPDL
ncbi:MAG TPA: DNA polymerase ligase N-terminal domain-containing protein [Acidimicrobiales bacterium]|nr:DNA polymerase ligase N-terminal domain-containing protein [Acidimicrobiales bacterium]